MKSRAVVAVEPGVLEMREYPLPDIGERDGLLKVELAGVCGSDPSIWRNKTQRGHRPYPIMLGHEVVGRIEKLGAAAAADKGLAEGDRVIVEYAFGCGRCRPCLAGRYTLCRKHYVYGSMVSCAEPPHLYGAYGDYMYLNERAMIHKVGEDLPAEVAVLICAVLGNAVRWLRQVGGASVGQPVAIVGPGQQGLAAVIVAKEAGCDPIMVVGLDQDKERLAMAERFGADLAINASHCDPVEEVSKATGGDMASLVLDVSGHPAGAGVALSLCGLGGAMVLPGLYGASAVAPWILDRIVFNEITLKGVFSHDGNAVRPAIKLAQKGKYPLQDLISHRFGLEEAEKALRLVAGENPDDIPMKVVLDPKL